MFDQLIQLFNPAYTVALPVAISHKASLKPKHCASATLIQKTSKNKPKHGAQKWDRLAVPFLGPHAQLSKRTKEQHFHGSRSHFWDRLAVSKIRPQNRKINSKGQPVQQTTNYNCVYSSNKHIDLQQRRPAHAKAKPDFN